MVVNELFVVEMEDYLVILVVFGYLKLCVDT